MFDIFNRKKVEELEGDIKTLYTLYESLERSTKSDRIFDSFVSNQEERDSMCHANHCTQNFRKVPEKKYEDINIKTVVGMILDKMGLRIKHKPAKKEVVRETTSEFVLRSVDEF